MIARDMKETKEIEIKGAKFTLGLIDAKTVRAFKSKMSYAKRMLLGDLDFNAQNLNASITKSEAAAVEADDALNAAFAGFVQYGVRGHSGIKDTSGQEIPCELDEKNHTVSEKTMSMYDNNGLIVPLASAVIEFNLLSEGDKKN